MINKNEESRQLVSKRNNQIQEITKRSLVQDTNRSNHTRQSLIHLNQCASPTSSNSRSKLSLSRLKCNGKDNNANNNSLLQFRKTITKSFKEDEAKNNHCNTMQTRLDVVINISENSESSGYDNNNKGSIIKEKEPYEKVNRRLVKRDKMV